MMHGREKSDLAIVAMKPANKAIEPTAEASTGASAAEPVERRAGAKGNAHQQSTHWTQSQARVSQALERIRQAIAVIHPRWEPYAGKPPVRFCAGGAMKIASLPLQRRELFQHRFERVGADDLDCGGVRREQGGYHRAKSDRGGGHHISLHGVCS